MEDFNWILDTQSRPIHNETAFTVWTTKEGQRIPIKDMNTFHIKNCIKSIVKSSYKWRKEYLFNLVNELISRKDF